MDQATQLWHELQDGSWSVVDQVDHDQRRFLLTRRNASPGDRAFTKREREVIALSSHGHANKVIAFELGITPSTVSTHLSRAAAKLGMSSRYEIMQTCVALASSDVAVKYVDHAGERYAVLALPIELRIPVVLSPAQREVAVLVFQGLSNAAIAKVRKTSVRTVANQIAAILRKLKVGSRAQLIAYLMKR